MKLNYKYNIRCIISTYTLQISVRWMSACLGDALHDVAQRTRRSIVSHRRIHRFSLLYRDRQS